MKCSAPQLFPFLVFAFVHAAAANTQILRLGFPALKKSRGSPPSLRMTEGRFLPFSFYLFTLAFGPAAAALPVAVVAAVAGCAALLRGAATLPGVAPET